jgi:hypothetical protein
MRDRKSHLDWCKARALEYIAAGDTLGAVKSMQSDLLKAEEPLYPPEQFRTLMTDGMLFRQTPDEVRSWINGFN